jgi:hypothetical protein
MFDDLASPRNERMQKAMDRLLTAPLAKLLRNRRYLLKDDLIDIDRWMNDVILPSSSPWDLLKALNENVEKTTQIWNVKMRDELLEFSTERDASREVDINEEELEATEGFAFSLLRDELLVGGIYVRVFIKSPAITDIENPSRFGRDLVSFLREHLLPESPSAVESPARAIRERFEGLDAVRQAHCELAMEALQLLVHAETYIAQDLCSEEAAVAAVFLLLELVPTEPDYEGPLEAMFTSTLRVLDAIFGDPQCIQRVLKAETPQIWRFVKCLCTVNHPNIRCTSSSTSLYVCTLFPLPSPLLSSQPVWRGALPRHWRRMRRDSLRCWSAARSSSCWGS